MFSLSSPTLHIPHSDCSSGMFLVVAFSSSLDVAAIEMEMGLPLDYNRYCVYCTMYIGSQYVYIICICICTY